MKVDTYISVKHAEFSLVVPTGRDLSSLTGIAAAAAGKLAPLDLHQENTEVADLYRSRFHGFVRTKIETDGACLAHRDMAFPAIDEVVLDDGEFYIFLDRDYPKKEGFLARRRAAGRAGPRESAIIGSFASELLSDDDSFSTTWRVCMDGVHFDDTFECRLVAIEVLWTARHKAHRAGQEHRS